MRYNHTAPHDVYLLHRPNIDIDTAGDSEFSWDGRVMEQVGVARDNVQ